MSKSNNRYYVYCYMDPIIPYNKEHLGINFEFEPFYIGKGSGKRKFKHLLEAKQKNHTKSHKLNRIKSILKSGNDPLIIECASNLKEDEAFLLETSLITSIGRRDQKTGPLTNLYDSQGVNSSKEILEKQSQKGPLNWMYGKTHTKEAREKISKSKIKLVGELHPHFGKESPLKGKSYEDQFGKDKANELKLERSKILKEYYRKNPKFGRKPIKFRYKLTNIITGEVTKFASKQDIIRSLKTTYYQLKLMQSNNHSTYKLNYV